MRRGGGGRRVQRRRESRVEEMKRRERRGGEESSVEWNWRGQMLEDCRGAISLALCGVTLDPRSLTLTQDLDSNGKDYGPWTLQPLISPITLHV